MLTNAEAAVRISAGVVGLGLVAIVAWTTVHTPPGREDTAAVIFWVVGVASLLCIGRMLIGGPV